MGETVLILIKPDGIKKRIAGIVLNYFLQTNLEVLGLKLTNSRREISEKHYQHIQGTPFFEGVVSYLSGEIHGVSQVIVLALRGEDAIQKCRDLVGATNPEDADPQSIRGAMGRITSKGIWENVVHVSSCSDDAEREIKLWFDPEDLNQEVYETIQENVQTKQRIWK